MHRASQVHLPTSYHRDAPHPIRAAKPRPTRAKIREADPARGFDFTMRLGYMGESPGRLNPRDS